MSGTIGNNIGRHSGSIAVTSAGLSWDTAVVTGSTVTVEAGNGYWINTTSNACTITLPASAEAGDQIVIVDYARTWGTNKIIIDSNGLTFQGNADTYTVEYTTDGQSVNLVYSDSTKGWLPLEDDVVAYEPTQPPTQRAIFVYGSAASAYTSVSNLVNSSGVVGSDVTGVGTARVATAGATYGVDKAITAYGYVDSNPGVSISNLINNSGVVGSDVSGVGTARRSVAATAYGSDKAMFAYGVASSNSSLKNLVNTSGVVAADVSGVGTARQALQGVTYGGISAGTAMFAYGQTSGYVSLKNLVSSVGVIAADVTGVGTARGHLAAATYGDDKAFFAFGHASDYVSLKNLVTSAGVIGTDVTGVGTARQSPAGASYGGDKAIVAYGHDGSGKLSVSNLVNSSGVVAADVTGVGTARTDLVAAGYSLSA